MTVLTDRDSGGDDLEQAIGWVRAILAVFAMVVVIGAGATRASGIDGLVVPMIWTAIISSTAGGLVVARRWTTSAGEAALWALQAGEIVWYVLLAGALAEVAPKVAWVILVVPIVTAALRLGDRAVMATWLASGGAYAGLTRPGFLSIEGTGQDTLERLAMLLAIATATAVLTRWLKDGWETQAALTAEAEARNNRLSTIEEASRQMQQAPSDRILDLCAAAIVELGFDAATTGRCIAGTVDLSGGPGFRAAGDGSVVPVAAVSSLPADNLVEVARWERADGEAVNSAIIRIGDEDVVFAGWSRQAVSESQATALCDLVASTMTALDAARHYERARYNATHDPLTGLVNRAELADQLERATSGPGVLAVVFIDLDYFKPVNDTHGHQVGDGLLVEIARRLARIAGDDHVVARYGGDEFVLVAADLSPDAAVMMAEGIRLALATPFPIAGHELQISGSIGLLSTSEPIDPATAIRLADEAAYSAKTSGRNQVHCVRSQALHQGQTDPGLSAEVKIVPEAHDQIVLTSRS